MPTNRDPLVSRGVKGPSPGSRALFTGLRALDPILQYAILAKGLADPLLNALNVYHSVDGGPAVALGLPLKPLILLAMATGTSIKQIYWVSYTAKEELNPTASIVVAFVNTILNSTNSILSLTAFAAAYNPAFLSAENKHGVSPLLILGTIGFIAGLGAEAISETQRKIFKDDEKNAGKPFTGGLFGLARHINYASYTLWRASYALVSGGWVWAALSGAFFTSDFLTRAIPVLDEYCVNRYGVQWTEYKKKVPYSFIPGVY